MLVDLIVNGRRFFSHNSINSVLTWYRNYERKYPWQRMMLKRAHVLVWTEAVLAFLSVFLVLMGFSGGGRGSTEFALVVALLLAGIGIYFIYRYLRRYGQTVEDLGLLVAHIEKVKNGDMETKLHVAPDADIYLATQNLNSIQEGMSLAVSEKVRSERMKVDLITNVSHDLKTPLTSIVSYVELLAKEENLPENANDYVAILAQKTERLKNLCLLYTSSSVKNSEAVFCPEFQGNYSHKHVLWTAQFIEDMGIHLKKISGDSEYTLEHLAAKHHKPSNFYEEIIQMADHLSSGMDRAEGTPFSDESKSWDSFKKVRMLSVFENLLKDDEPDFNFKLPVGAIKLTEDFFPRTNFETHPDYKSLWEGFMLSLIHI